MLKKKCPSCGKKIERSFNYCPHCGASFKTRQEKSNFGMLGRNDIDERNIEPDLKLPFGMEKIMGSLIKQLEKQMNNLDLRDVQGMPKGIKIRVARGPEPRQLLAQAPKKIQAPAVSEEENQRRVNLPKIDAKSKVKRLSDTIIYEIETPGVKKKGDVVLTELATGLEIKAYSDKKCYVKFIPLKLEVVEYHVEKEKVLVEMKS